MRLSTKLLLLGFLILLINSAYLISFGEPTLFYIGNVLIHIVLGVVLIVPFIVYVCKRFDGMSIIGFPPTRRRIRKRLPLNHAQTNA